jgi:tetratricopeptide (TPR) repeat protein
MPPLRIFAIVIVVLAGAGCGRSPISYLARGNSYAAEFKYDDAALQYRKAIQKDPRFGEAYFQLGLVEVQQGNAPGAYSDLNQAVLLMPGREAPKARLADLNLFIFLNKAPNSERFYSQVVKLSDEILEKNPNSADGLRLKGGIALVDRNPKEAAAYYRKANQIAPANVDVLEGFAQALFGNGQSAEGEQLALAFLEKNKSAAAIYNVLYAHYLEVGRLDDAEKLLKRKIANSPGAPAYRLELARHYARLKKPAEMTAALQSLLEDGKQFPQGYFQAGDFYRGLGKLEEARGLFEQGGRLHPRDRILYQKRIANVLLAQGKRDEAIKVVEAILQSQPKDGEALRVRAESLLDSARPEERARALFEFQQLAVQNPADAAVRFGLGRAYFLKGDTKSARNEWEHAANLNRTFIPPRYALAELSLAQNKPQDALKRSEEVLALDSRDSWARYLHATALIGTGRYDAAQPELTALAQQFPDSADVQLQLGMLAISQGKPKEAEAIFQKIQNGNHSDLRPGVALAESYSSLKQFDSALQLLLSESKKAPGSPMLGNLIAVAAVRAGKYDVAIEAYRRQLQAAPNSASVYRSLVEIYMVTGKYTDAISTAEQGLQVASSDARMEVMLAAALRQAGRVSEVSGRLEHALHLDPENPAIMNNVAYFLAENGTDLDRALSLAQRATQKAPREPGFTDTLGWIYLKKNMTDAALQIFTNLAAKYPDNPTYHYHLGAALAAHRDWVQARAELNTALLRGPDKSDEREIRELESRLY